VYCRKYLLIILLKNEALNLTDYIWHEEVYFHSHHLSWTVPSGNISSSKTSAALLSLPRDGEVVWA
jgi:hypothetical protein